jgi:beta-lactamase class C
MNEYRRRVGLYPLIAFLLTWLGCGAPPVPPSTVGTSLPGAAPLDSAQLALARSYDRHFNVLINNNPTLGAAVVIVQDTQVLLLKGYGVRRAHQRDTVDAHTVFRLGSLSKGFTGVLAGVLVQNGQIQWDQPVQSVLPEFVLRDKTQARRMRLWHLLSHTSGLPYHAFTNLIEADYDLPTIVRQYLPKAPISGREGVFYAYQNVAFCVGADMLASSSHTPYSDLLRQRIFEPLGMRDASCSAQSMRSNPNSARPMWYDGYRWHSDTINDQYYGGFVAAGGVNASAADMAQWLRLLLGGRPDLVTNTTLDQVFRPVVKTDKERHLFPGWAEHHSAGYAMGWRVLHHDQHEIIYHAGAVNGFYCEIALDRKRGYGICVLTNARSAVSGQCVTDFFDLLEPKVK